MDDKAAEEAYNTFMENVEIEELFDRLEEKIENMGYEDFSDLTAPHPIPEIYVNNGLFEISQGIIDLCREAVYIVAVPEFYTLFEGDDTSGYDKAIEEAYGFVEEAIKVANGLYVVPESVKKAILIADAFVSGEEKESFEDLKKAYNV